MKKIWNIQWDTKSLPLCKFSNRGDGVVYAIIKILIIWKHERNMFYVIFFTGFDNAKRRWCIAKEGVKLSACDALSLLQKRGKRLICRLFFSYVLWTNNNHNDENEYNKIIMIISWENVWNTYIPLLWFANTTQMDEAHTLNMQFGLIYMYLWKA